MAKPKPRVLRKLISPVKLKTEDVSATGVTIDSTQYSDNWTVLTGENMPVPNIAVWRGYFDTQGYSLEELTFFPTNPQVQEQGALFATMGNVIVYDFITVKPLSDVDIQNIKDLNQVSAAPPGSLHSNHDLQDIIYGQWRVFTINTTENFNVISQQGTYGLNTPTSRDRIFCTRVVLTSLADNTEAYLGPAAFVLGGVTAEEKDLVHMERLRRNYDHSSQQDTDSS